MQYLYNESAGTPQLTLEGDDHRYIFRVRRHKADDRLYLRNLKDGVLYRYLIVSMDKRTALLVLEESTALEVKARRVLHIGWCVIDPKNIEKVLPSLNEIGVAKITFIYCRRSQKSFKPDFKRLEKILLNSSQQSGRSVMMQLEMAESLKEFKAQYPQSKMLHFSENSFIGNTGPGTIVIGCEGGFHEEEATLFDKDDIIGFDTPLILKSESAVCAAASKLLL
ncbi:Ribosomal RNA small subunit methyltransferase E [hydrothermal vent metagenome]|uniref:16S rRNA (uracil(1498)-N(3))-methyltransferase n=1 Tax=hydrothermal vent metagenome TaxID=652676 RepID=A0A1W1CH02_9ZZZZ